VVLSDASRIEAHNNTAARRMADEWMVMMLWMVMSMYGWQ